MRRGSKVGVISPLTLTNPLFIALLTALCCALLTPLGADSAYGQTISVANAQAVEPAAGSTNMVFTVTLSTASAQTVSVDFTTNPHTGGTNPATVGTDYTASSGNVVFAAGQTIKTINVPVLADAEYPETNETFLVDLSNPINATVSNAQAVGTIRQGNTPGTLRRALCSSASCAQVAPGAPAMTMWKSITTPTHHTRWRLRMAPQATPLWHRTMATPAILSSSA